MEIRYNQTLTALAAMLSVVRIRSVSVFGGMHRVVTKMRRMILLLLAIGLGGGMCLVGLHFRTSLPGVEEAWEQIRRGHLTLYTFGLRDFDRSYDPATGLPLEGIAGCEIDESVSCAMEHNDYIKKWIDQGNTPPNSLRRYNRLIAKPFSEIPARNLSG